MTDIDRLERLARAGDLSVTRELVTIYRRQGRDQKLAALSPQALRDFAWWRLRQGNPFEVRCLLVNEHNVTARWCGLKVLDGGEGLAPVVIEGTGAVTVEVGMVQSYRLADCDKDLRPSWSLDLAAHDGWRGLNLIRHLVWEEDSLRCWSSLQHMEAETLLDGLRELMRRRREWSTAAIQAWQQGCSDDHEAGLDAVADYKRGRFAACLNQLLACILNQLADTEFWLWSALKGRHVCITDHYDIPL
jgi:hypothetical protein